MDDYDETKRRLSTLKGLIFGSVQNIRDHGTRPTTETTDRATPTVTTLIRPIGSRSTEFVCSHDEELIYGKKRRKEKKS